LRDASDFGVIGGRAVSTFLARVLARRYRPRIVDDPDIWRAANLLVKRHGADAAIEVHRRLVARSSTNMPRKLLAPIAPLFRDLERDAERILGRGR